MSNFSDTHIEQLSAYLDHRLSPAERRALESQLEQNPALRAELAELQSAVQVLRDLPAVMPPRTFTLDPATYQRRRPIFSVMRWAGAFGAFMLIIAVGLGVFSSSVQNKLGSPPWIAAQSAATTQATPASGAADSALRMTEDPAAGGAEPDQEAAKIEATPPAAGNSAPPAGGAPMGSGPATSAPAATTAAAATVPPAATSAAATIAPAATMARPTATIALGAPAPTSRVQQATPVAGAATIAPTQPAPNAPLAPAATAALVVPANPAGQVPTMIVEPPLAAGAVPQPLETVPLSAGAVPAIGQTESSSPGTVSLSDTNDMGYYAGADDESLRALGERPAGPSARREPSLGLIFLMVALLGASLAAIVIGWRMMRTEAND